MEKKEKIHEEKLDSEQDQEKTAPKQDPIEENPSMKKTDAADVPEETEADDKQGEDALALEQEMTALRDQFVRLQADFQNYRNRAERDKQDTVRFANERLIVDLLEVVDNFERAIATEKEHDAFFQGMEMIDHQIRSILEKNGVEEIISDGAVFDPNLHNAVLSEESDTVESGHVIETMVKGYTLYGRMIRPAMVKVAR
ncbi:MAG: nucleotide exchange factor GrpE [Peptoniphilaceae bacterium]|nr:nucleotide exchange factor GrpE [Peptoniphilaceae bacterium]MDY5766572.1 nucleotide exchange factor GrpE [Peptoniphilaceae bacterium]